MNKYVKEKLVLKRNIRSFINKVLITIIIVLVGLIVIKDNPELKEKINEFLYEKSLSFTKTKQIYEKYFGNFLSIEKKIKDTTPVFSEKMTYHDIKAYKEGAKLEVDNNYLVPAIESGVVIFIGKKEGYGNTIIIEQIDGVKTIYSNVNNNNIKLYDYIEKGEIIGEVEDNNLYIF